MGKNWDVVCHDQTDRPLECGNRTLPTSKMACEIVANPFEASRQVQISARRVLEFNSNTIPAKDQDPFAVVRRIGIVNSFHVGKMGPQCHQESIEAIAFGQRIRLRMQFAKPVGHEFGDQQTRGILSECFCYEDEGKLLAEVEVMHQR
jgi:hypothetical protein